MGQRLHGDAGAARQPPADNVGPNGVSNPLVGRGTQRCDVQCQFARHPKSPNCDRSHHISPCRTGRANFSIDDFRKSNNLILKMPGADPRMKIVSVKPIVVRSYRANWVFVRIRHRRGHRRNRRGFAGIQRAGGRCCGRGAGREPERPGCLRHRGACRMAEPTDLLERQPDRAKRSERYRRSPVRYQGQGPRSAGVRVTGWARPRPDQGLRQHLGAASRRSVAVRRQGVRGGGGGFPSAQVRSIFSRGPTA